MSTDETLDRIRAERDDARQAAIAAVESDDWNPEDPAFKKLETRARDLDQRAAALVTLRNAQRDADHLDGLLARAAKSRQRAEQRSTIGPAAGLPHLVPTRDELRQAAEAIETGQTQHRIQLGRLQTRAAVTSAETGGAVAPISDPLPEPRRLAVVARLTPQPIPAHGASGPRYGLLSPLPPTAEGQLKHEADDITPAQLVPQMLARWTEITVQASLEAPLEDVSRWHAGGIALDEDALIIAALAAEAGTAQPGTGNPDADIRSAMATVEANAAAPADVIICNPADVGRLTGTTPANADDAASHVAILGGARIYPSVSQPAGTAMVAALNAIGRYGVARETTMLTALEPKTNMITVLTELFSGFVVRQSGGVRAVTLDAAG